MREETNVYRVLMGKPEGKRMIRMDLREIGWNSVDWIQLAQDRDRRRAVVNTLMNLRVLSPRI
jgi:tRNA pseudouridine-54 N-methylase